ncbi:Tetratricopeptide repeat-containing protein [Capnocytophaga haemolytica]|uniref:Photosystem I assembly protein Ycf3 n=1 Tax=Capnocytophaga haemolytica TaxID=45243 RepID=A0AAX2GYT4_9FLAO|nr:tetratricopeptide repeat protein [Capnocytophaga haemolytica]AMD85354.1 hypothetical protein AXF12_07430 [Capnocytophaga haemolytica]SFO14025.1 Tetratricopeptide repeat-containing protein [Capnocytophaga haemolytica]SNV02681.1 photosystem I assembly protein Ycf3 [Capnocytophaga haemolytica]
MKKPLLIASALLISAVAFGQKKELKEIEKQIKRGELAEAQSGLNALKGNIDGTEFAPQFYFLEGSVNVEQAKKNTNVLSSLQAATTAFAKVKQLEGGKGKYASQIQALSNEAVNLAMKQAQQTYERKDLKNAAVAFEQVYRLSPRDTVFLYNAAVVAVENKDYNTALKHYKELKDLGYDGAEVQYIATNKQTNKEESFPDKNQRDIMVKGGTHIKPRQEKTPSRRADIIKNIAFIYVEQGKSDDALKAFAEARKAYPKDANLILAEANIYLQLDKKDEFKQRMQEAAQLDPNNADLHYNIGVINMQQGNIAEARKGFEQALKIKPKYPEAALNLSTTYINEGNGLIEEMNKLGNSAADIKKFNELKAQKETLFKKGAEVLENYTKANGNDNSILEQLKNIYGALGDSANFQRLKKLLGQ